MKTLSMFALGLWLAMGTGLPAGAQPTLPQGSPDHPCEQTPGADESQDPDGHPIIATVKEIDHQQGTLELDTEDGRFSLAIAPAEIQDLQEGDQLLVCLEGNNIEGEDRLADPGL